MESLLTGLVKTNLEKLIDGVIGEFRYVCCFTSIVKEFKEEQTRLKEERKTVEQRVEERTKKVDQLLREDIKTKKKCFFGFCPDCIWRYKKGKELANNIVKMKQLVEITPPLSGVEFHSSHNYIHFKSRESKYKELLEALKNENNFTTGLHGMGGSGKTTLAIKVGKELKQSENFASVIDVKVSYTPNIKKIQNDIAGPLGLEWKDCNESDRPKKLRSRLTNGEKILLILDDVWDQKPPLDFDAIGIPQQDNNKGCRVLVITRNEGVLKRMGCDERIKLEVLSEEDSQIMFKSYAGITKKSGKNLIDKGREIADKCKKLPVAIAAVAMSLKGQQSIEEWDSALQYLQDPQSSIQDVDKSLVEIYNCLKFSYDFLKDEKVERLFLLCSIFPKDEEINVEILTRISLGAGLFGEDYGRYNDARNQVVVAKNKLVDSCLLLEGDEGYVKMHDLVRDAAQWIANQEIRTVNMSRKDPKSLIDRDKNTKYLFWEGKEREMFSSSFGGSKLEILIASFDADGDGGRVKVPNSFFENMVGLRVLHLNYKQISYTPLAFSLQRSIQSLKNIRSLLVCEVNLGDISVLGNLQCLETLDLDSCEITELPHEITKLEKFKLLKLRRCKIIRNNPFEVIEKFFLDELYFYDSFNEFCKEINFFPTLQRYVISTQWRDVESDVLVSKVVELYENIFSEATLKYFIQTTQYLVLGSIKWRWRNLIPEIVPVDQGMNDLVHLDLKNSSELQYLIKVVGSQVPNVFSKLVVLKLHGMEKLEELCNGPLDLCNLKRISLSKCPLLVSVFQLSTAKSLIMLEKLKIDDCGQLESIIADEKSGEESKEEILVDDGDNEDKKHNSMFSKLKSLYIKNCPQVEVVLPFLSGDLLIPLETISIQSCDKLKYIFDQFVELGSLKNVMLDSLPDFIGNFPESMALFAKASSSTLREDFKEPTQLDPIKCNVFSWTQKCCYGLKYKHELRSTTSTKIPLVSKCFSGQPQNLCNITTITLNTVSNIKSVFTLSIARRMLQLETLTIRNCVELKHIIVDTGDDNGGNNSSDVFPRLKDLNVVNCKQLEYIFGHCTDDHQSHNEIHLHLPELKSLELWYLPNLVAMCPKQYHTTSPPLVKLKLMHCSRVASKSIGDFISHASSTSLDNTTKKELSGNVENFLALETLVVEKSEIENVFFLNEKNGQQLNLMLNNIILQDLPVMTYLFACPKSLVTLHKLTWIKIGGCEKLEIMFSTCVVRYFQQLRYLCIEKCKDLKHIIAEDEMMSNSLPTATEPCFPNLQTIVVKNCNKLEFIFPVSICKELYKLKSLMIREADALQEVFRSKDAQKVKIPNLKVIVFVNLPSLSRTQAIQFQNVEHRLVENCQKLSLTSVSYLSDDEIEDLDWGVSQQYIQDRRKEDSDSETTNKSIHSGHELSSSQFLEEIQAASPSKTRSKPPTQSLSPESKQESFKTSVEEGTMLVNAKTITSSTHSESGPLVTSEHKTSSNEVGYGKISITSNDQRVKDGNLTAKTSKAFSVGVKVQATLGHKLTTSESFKTSVETLDNAKTVPSEPLVTSEHKTSSQEDGDGEISIPSEHKTFVANSQETSESYASAMEDINHLIKEDPLVALEKLLTGKLSISTKPQKSVSHQSETEMLSFSVGTLLQELKTLMDSSDLDHLVSQQESKSKLVYLFQQLNQHQGVLSSDINDYVEKVQNFFNDYFVKHFTSQQLFNNHNTLLDSKTDLTNKLWSAKSTQTHIDNAASTAKTQMHELNLQIDDLRKQLAVLENQRGDLESVVNKCDVQKKKLKAECTDWVKQSIELLSALASSEVDVREAESLRNLAEQGFADFKSSFPTF